MLRDVEIFVVGRKARGHAAYVQVSHRLILIYSCQSFRYTSSKSLPSAIIVRLNDAYYLLGSRYDKR